MERPTECLERWMAEHGPAVLGLARRILRDGHAAEDVFQDTFVKAYCRALPFNDGGHARAWLLRVAANDCISRMRSPWRRRVSLACDVPDPGEPTLSRTDLFEALERLPSRYRDAVWLYYYAGYDTNEIAELSRLPAATVRTRLARAREKLKGLLVRSGAYEAD